MIPLAMTQPAAQPDPDQIDLEALIAQAEHNWPEITTEHGTWYNDPACLDPVEENQ
jgi:hypothetical protein